MTRPTAAGLAAAMVLAWGATRVRAAQPERTTWKIGADTRTAIVYAPSAKTPSGKSPLILVFHGHGDTAENFQDVDLQRAWPEAIVVYFQGAPSSRDHAPGWQTEKGQDGDRDLQLVDTALTALRNRFRVDDSRIYATGFSNGAGFTFLLWAERPSTFAAFGIVAGRIRASEQPRVPKPLLQIAGRQDTTIPFREQEAAIEIAKRVDGVKDKGTACGVDCTMYGGATSTPLLTWIHPGGHEYPSGTSELIVKFFRPRALD